jgi:hypothetical protein
VLIAWAVSCEEYELRADGTVDIYAAGFDTFYVERLPATIDITILVRVHLVEDERAKIDVHVLGPDTVPLGALKHEVVAAPGSNHRPGYLVTQTEALEVKDLQVESEGVYSVEVYADPARGPYQERRRSIFFTVREGLPSN